MIIDIRTYQFRHNLPTVTRVSMRTLVFAILLSGIATTAPAAEFSIKPFIQSGIRYDDNPRRRSTELATDSAQGLLFDVRLPMQYRSPRSSITLNPRVVRSFYRKEENADLEDKDQYLTGAASRQSRRSNIGASYGYTNLSLRTSEFEDTGSGGSLRLNEDTQKLWYFQPNWQYQFSQANLISLGAGHTDVRYDEERLSRRFDYTFSNASAMLQHAINTRHTLTLQARFTKFDSENRELRITNDSKTNSLNLIYTYSWTERTTVSANGGWARTKNEVMRPNDIDPVTGPFCNPFLIPIFPCVSESDSTNFVGNLAVSHTSETVNYRVAIGQSITPNSNGAEVLRFNVNASASKKFSEKISGRLGIMGFTQSNIGDSDLGLDRDFIRGELGLSYKFKRNWSFYGIYRYLYNKDKRVLLDEHVASNNFVSVGIRYQGDGWRW